MTKAIELLREGKREELWRRCCGFIDLSIEEVMGIQQRLLLEQIQLLNKSELGARVMRGAKPRSVEEFRALVPITTYDDYVPELPEQREEGLPEKPLAWHHTAGLRCYSGEYGFKWVPITERIYRELGDTCLAMLIFASCRDRGDIVLEEGDKFLYGLAPPPYSSGSWGRRAAEEGIFDFLPPLDEAEQMAYEKRISKGFRLGLSQGIDLMMAMASVLVGAGEWLDRSLALKDAVNVALRRGEFRVLRAILKSRAAGRAVLPRDLWPLKALVSTGTDASVYRDKIKEMWGRYPLAVYGSTETVIMATQLWDYEGMTFLPHTNFIEFVPEDESRKWLADPGYTPAILTLDQVKPGEKYAIVVTNFYGGPFVRYFIGDVLTITSLRNANLGVDIPQMVFDSRIDGILDIAGFTRLSEKTIWQAIENSGLVYEEWTVLKEIEETPVMHLYIELKRDGDAMHERAVARVHEQLVKLDPDYGNLETMLGMKPLKVTLLPRGTFFRYFLKQREAGADLAHLKPPHMNPSDDVVERLLQSVEETPAESRP